MNAVKNMGRAFRAKDPEGSGLLPFEDFKRCLQESGIEFQKVPTHGPVVNWATLPTWASHSLMMCMFWHSHPFVRHHCVRMIV